MAELLSAMQRSSGSLTLATPQWSVRENHWYNEISPTQVNRKCNVVVGMNEEVLLDVEILNNRPL